MRSAKIVKEVPADEFKELISRHRGNILVGYHAISHMSNAQRKIFKESDLLHPLLRENPAGVGLQQNGRYAAFYRRKSGYIRIIIQPYENKLEIVTFVNTDNMPNLKRLK